MIGVFLTLCVAAAPAEPATARFVVIVASNSTAEQLPLLRYADDDAVAYWEHLQPFAQSVDLLTTLDDATQRRHPQLAQTARLPTRAELFATMAKRFAELKALKAAGRRTELTFIFVGHGGVDEEGRGFLHLSDGRLTRDQLFTDILKASPADLTHAIIDACHAMSLVAGRGADEKANRQRALADFLSSQQLEDFPSVGVLVATSDSNQTQEWSRIEAGVFSHLVRSALTGAADVNQDGRVEYSEAAAFIDSASADLRRYGHSLKVFAWPPTRDRHAALVDLGTARDQRFVVIGEGVAGRMTLDTEQGDHWAETNKAPGAAMTLGVPAQRGFFLRQNEREQWISPGSEVVWVDEAPRGPTTIATRGAEELALERGLFNATFGTDYYRGFVSSRDQLLPVIDGTPLVTRPEPLRWAVRLEGAYAAGLFLFRSDFLEHAGSLRILFWPGERLFVGLTPEIGFASLRGTQSTQALRLQLWLGPGLRLPMGARIATRGALELGVGGLAFWGGAVSSEDLFIPAARARVGLEIALTGSLGLAIDLSLAAHLVTVEGREEPRLGPQLSLAAVWLR